MPLIGDESRDDVSQEGRNLVVEIVPRQAAAKGDRAGRKYGAALCGLKIYHIAADQRVRHVGGQRIGGRDQQVLQGDAEMSLVTFGTREQAQVGRRAQQGVCTVKFKARSATAGESETTNGLAIHAVEDPGKIRRMGFLGAAVS